MTRNDTASNPAAKRSRHSRGAHPASPPVAPEVEPEPKAAAPAVVTRSARVLAATGIASIKTILEPLVRSVRRRALLAVIVGLLWLAAICFALVAVVLFLATWIGAIWAAVAIAVVLALAGMVLHLASGSISRSPL
jgi:hypothetical protein